MAFWATLIQTIIKMVIVGAAAFGGIMLGKTLRLSLIHISEPTRPY